MSSRSEVTVFWFRNDLRIDDNHGLFRALNSQYPVVPVFIFDPEILDKLPDKADRKMNFIHHYLIELQQWFTQHGSSMIIFHRKPADAFHMLSSMFDVREVITNRIHEPYYEVLDQSIGALLEEKNIAFSTYKDRVIFEPEDILKADNTPYEVFTPYAKAWKRMLQADDLDPYDSSTSADQFFKTLPFPIPALKNLGLVPTELYTQAPLIKSDVIKNYGALRDIPSASATSRLSVHLRYGTISIRHVVRAALALNETWLNELIWREFFIMVLYHNPHVVHSCYHKKYDRLAWRNNEAEFERWCNGETGYPIVDAGMRELNETGFMHNRVRMITASFLTKHLLIDWRWGEAYFADKLTDYDLALNNGNWQWVAGTGCDAAPYFRVFNPALQAKRYDPEMKYQEKWLGDLRDYTIEPMVDHSMARERAIQAFRSITP